MNESMNRAPTRIALAALLAVALTGCATTQNKDPLEPLNRKIFGFNEAVDQVLLKPVAQGYANVTPEPVQTALSNVISNIKGVWSAVNLFLQGRVGEGAEAVLRVGINTTFGLAGVLDVASEMQLDRPNEDLGQTLGVWGMSSGAYMVLPFFGPSTVRDTLALPADNYFSLPSVFREVRDANGARLLTVVHTRAQLLGATSLMSDVALDKYAFVRDAYLQRRQNLIYNGDPPDYEQSLWQQPDIMGLPLAGRALPTPALMWSAGGARDVAPGVKVASLGSDLPVLPLAPTLSGPNDEELAGLRAEPELR